MVKLKRFPNNTSKTLINDNGRLSDCPCCCPNLPDTLCVHFDPVFTDSGGENSDCSSLPDTKWGTEYFQLASNFGGGGSCNVWGTDYIYAPDSSQQCYSGVGPPVTFGIGISVFCYAIDSFRATLCLDTTGGYPLWPDDPTDCEQRLELLVPVAENTCDAMPGEFWIDFGNVTPLGDNTDRTSTGKNVSGTASACTCKFHLWVDECMDFLQDQYPVYYYPAEGSGGIPDIHGALWAWEEMPGVGTPLHPTKRPALRKPTGKRVGVGTRIGRRLAKANIQARSGGGCSCNELAAEMNRHSPEMILTNLAYWAPKLQKSAEQWLRKEKSESSVRGFLARALRPISYAGAKHLITKACNDELAGVM